MLNRLAALVVNLCRLVLGLTFVMSGYVKAIDPLGTQYKLQDYLAALDLAGLVPRDATLIAAVVLGAVEFSLGTFMLFAIRRRLVSRLMLVLMTVMTLLTVWIYLYDPVKDCGCFGDAFILSNAETLLKNVILLACAAAVAWRPVYMVRLISKSNQWIVMNYAVVYILFTSLWCLYSLPTFDFRPYRLGVNIKKAMTIPEGAPRTEYATTFIMRKDGKTKEFDLDHYPDSTWEFVDSRTVVTKQGYEPPVHDFSMTSVATGEDVTDSVLTRRGYTFLLVSPTLAKADDSNFGDIDQIYEYARDNNVPFYCLTASTERDINHWRDITGAEYQFFNTDETTLKTIIRSNPGLLLLKDGTIIGKWSHNLLPQTDDLTAPLDKLPIGKLPEDEGMMAHILKVVLTFVLPLVLLTVADRLWAWTKWIKRKRNNNKIFQIFKQKKENEKENCSR